MVFSKNILSLTAGISLIFLAASCNIDDTAKPQQEVNNCRLTKMTVAGTDVITYQYDAQKRLQKAEYSGDATRDNYVKEYTYDAAGRVSKETFKSTNGDTFSYFTFEYEANNLLKKIAFYSRSNQENALVHQYEKVIGYKANGQVEKVSTYAPENKATPSRYDIYTYDDKGNVTKIEEFVQNGTSTVNDVSTEYTYDSKKNPYLGVTFLGVGAEMFSKNNIASQKETYHLSGLTKMYTHNYQYNEKEYPAKETITTGTQTYEVDWEYSCAE